jgi:hypothetical protein
MSLRTETGEHVLHLTTYSRSGKPKIEQVDRKTMERHIKYARAVQRTLREVLQAAARLWSDPPVS